MKQGPEPWDFWKPGTQHRWAPQRLAHAGPAQGQIIELFQVRQGLVAAGRYQELSENAGLPNFRLVICDRWLLKMAQSKVRGFTD